MNNLFTSSLLSEAKGMGIIMKNYLVMLLVVLMMLTVVSGTVDAAKDSPGEELTMQELKVLEKKVGMTEEDISQVPTDILRQLIKENAKKISVGPGVKSYDVASEGNGSSEDISIMGDIPDNDLTLYGIAFLVSSDCPDKKRFIFTVLLIGR